VTEATSTALAELSPIEEQFALAYFRNGGNAAEAYRTVKPDVTKASAWELGSRMLRRVGVKAAIEALRQELRERVPVDTEVIAQRLKAQALGNITDVLRWGEPLTTPDGKPVEVAGQVVRGGLELVPSSELTPEQAALIEEIEISPTEHGVKRKVKLVNRTAAAKLLLELRGELVKNVKVEGEVVHRVMALPTKQPSREEWAAQFAPGRQVTATVESIEENERG
jgi:phage terminase small subunit